MKQNINTILTYIAIFVSIIMFIIVVYYINKNNKKEYEGFNDIIVSSDFYDIADSNNNFIFSNNEETSDKKINDFITASNLCIYNSNKDMECITSGELGIVNKLPKMRYETVCIDEECLDIEDVKILTGKKSFKLSHNNKPLDGDDCLGLYKVNAQTCKPVSIDKFNSLGITKCRSGSGKNQSNFVLEPSNLTRDKIGQIITNPKDILVPESDIARAAFGSVTPEH